MLSQRIQIKQAAKIRLRMCEQLGHKIEVDGHSRRTFPAPHKLRAMSSIDGLTAVKLERLHAVADATLDGRLAAALRAVGPAQALDEVQKIAGIGPFSADLIVVRGAGEPDHFSRTERRLHAAMTRAYGIDARDVDALAAIAEGCKPFSSTTAATARRPCRHWRGSAQKGTLRAGRSGLPVATEQERTLSRSVADA